MGGQGTTGSPVGDDPVFHSLLIHCAAMLMLLIYLNLRSVYEK